MTAPEPEDIVLTFKTVCAERPTFAAMALAALADRDREIARLRALNDTQAVWLRIWDAYRRFPVPRPALTPEQIDRITRDVIAAVTQEQGT